MTNLAIALGLTELEHRHFRPAPVQHALAVTQSAIHIKMPPFNRVIPMRELAAAMLIEAPTDAAGRKLPPVRVAREHPLPRISQQFLGIDRVVVQTDDGQTCVDAGKT